MNNNITLIQYLPLTRPLASYALTKKLFSKNRNVILDLEDSAQDIFDSKHNLELKKIARDGLLTISNYKLPISNSKLYVRINSPKTEFYNLDISIIKKVIKNNFKIDGIFLPMTESFDEIANLNEYFNNIEIVPMIETKDGFKNLENILSHDKENLIKRVHYGNFDFSYSSEFWPFLDPNHDKYWEIINDILTLLKKYKKSFVGSPFPFPHNEKLFWQCNFYTEKIADLKEIWHCCVNSTLALSSRLKYSKLELIKYDFSNSEKIKIAKNIINDFIEGRSNKRSFGVSNHRFIAPHQFLAAKKYLDENE